MPLKVKDIAVAMAKFVNRGSGAAQDYANGIKGAGATWQANAAAAEPNYDAGVQAAIARQAYSKGVTKAGGSKYENRASTVGAQRYPQGIRDAGPAWEAGFGPYQQTLASLTLPPKRPHGDPANYARVQFVGDALRKKKIGA